MHRFALYVFTLDGSRSDADATLAQCYTRLLVFPAIVGLSEHLNCQNNT